MSLISSLLVTFSINLCTTLVLEQINKIESSDHCMPLLNKRDHIAMLASQHTSSDARVLYYTDPKAQHSKINNYPNWLLRLSTSALPIPPYSSKSTL